MGKAQPGTDRQGLVVRAGKAKDPLVWLALAVADLDGFVEL